MPGLIGDRIAILKLKTDKKTNRALEKGDLPDDKWVISNGLISTWEDKEVDTFSSTALEKFLKYYDINKEWWNTGEGTTFNKNSTKHLGNSMENPEEVYRTIVEGKTEYLLIPRSVLQENYRLVSIEQIQKDEKQMEKLNKYIDGLMESQEKLVTKLGELLQTQVAHPQKR